MYKIVISNPGNHFCNPLLKLADREYANRDEACEAIYDALYDVIDGENGCEMVDREKILDYRMVTMKTSYGDRLDVRNNVYNCKGQLLDGWEVVGKRYGVCSPEEMVSTGMAHPAMPKDAYSIVRDETFDQYSDYCRDYILREGYAAHDGVTANVEEVAG